MFNILSRYIVPVLRYKRLRINGIERQIREESEKNSVVPTKFVENVNIYVFRFYYIYKRRESNV